MADGELERVIYRPQVLLPPERPPRRLPNRLARLLGRLWRWLWP